MKELKIGCGKPTGSKVGEPGRENTAGLEAENKKELAMSIAKVGAKAPDFEAPAYQGGGSCCQVPGYPGTGSGNAIYQC